MDILNHYKEGKFKINKLVWHQLKHSNDYCAFTKDLNIDFTIEDKSGIYVAKKNDVLLFENHSLSKVKQYCEKVHFKIVMNIINNLITFE